MVKKYDFFVRFGSDAKDLGPAIARDLESAERAITHFSALLTALERQSDQVMAKANEAAGLDAPARREPPKTRPAKGGFGVVDGGKTTPPKKSDPPPGTGAAPGNKVARVDLAALAALKSSVNEIRESIGQLNDAVSLMVTAIKTGAAGIGNATPSGINPVTGDNNPWVKMPGSTRQFRRNQNEEWVDNAGRPPTPKQLERYNKSEAAKNREKKGTRNGPTGQYTTANDPQGYDATAKGTSYIAKRGKKQRLAAEAAAASIADVPEQTIQKVRVKGGKGKAASTTVRMSDVTEIQLDTAVFDRMVNVMGEVRDEVRALRTGKAPQKRQLTPDEAKQKEELAKSNLTRAREGGKKKTIDQAKKELDLATTERKLAEARQRLRQLLGDTSGTGKDPERKIKRNQRELARANTLISNAELAAQDVQDEKELKKLKNKVRGARGKLEEAEKSGDSQAVKDAKKVYDLAVKTLQAKKDAVAVTREDRVSVKPTELSRSEWDRRTELTRNLDVALSEDALRLATKRGPKQQINKNQLLEMAKTLDSLGYATPTDSKQTVESLIKSVVASRRQMFDEYGTETPPELSVSSRRPQIDDSRSERVDRWYKSAPKLTKEQAASLAADQELIQATYSLGIGPPRPLTVQEPPPRKSLLQPDSERGILGSQEEVQNALRKQRRQRSKWMKTDEGQAARRAMEAKLDADAAEAKIRLDESDKERRIELARAQRSGDKKTIAYAEKRAATQDPALVRALREAEGKVRKQKRSGEFTVSPFDQEIAKLKGGLEFWKGAQRGSEAISQTYDLSDRTLSDMWTSPSMISAPRKTPKGGLPEMTRDALAAMETRDAFTREMAAKIASENPDFDPIGQTQKEIRGGGKQAGADRKLAKALRAVIDKVDLMGRQFVELDTELGSVNKQISAANKRLKKVADGKKLTDEEKELVKNDPARIRQLEARREYIKGVLKDEGDKNFEGLGKYFKTKGYRESLDIRDATRIKKAQERELRSLETKPDPEYGKGATQRTLGRLNRGTGIVFDGEKLVFDGYGKINPRTGLPTPTKQQRATLKRVRSAATSIDADRIRLDRARELAKAGVDPGIDMDALQLQMENRARYIANAMKRLTGVPRPLTDLVQDQYVTKKGKLRPWFKQTALGEPIGERKFMNESNRKANYRLEREREQYLRGLAEAEARAKGTEEDRARFSATEATRSLDLAIETRDEAKKKVAKKKKELLGKLSPEQKTQVADLTNQIAQKQAERKPLNNWLLRPEMAVPGILGATGDGIKPDYSSVDKLEREFASKEQAALKKAKRRESSAKGVVTKAEKTGNPEKLARAEEKLALARQRVTDIENALATKLEQLPAALEKERKRVEKQVGYARGTQPIGPRTADETIYPGGGTQALDTMGYPAQLGYNKPATQAASELDREIAQLKQRRDELAGTDVAKRDKLLAELKKLGGRQGELSKEIGIRAKEGDLSENGGYHAAREEQGKNKARIDKIRAELAQMGFEGLDAVVAELEDSERVVKTATKKQVSASKRLKAAEKKAAKAREAAAQELADEAAAKAASDEKHGITRGKSKGKTVPVVKALAKGPEADALRLEIAQADEIRQKIAALKANRTISENNDVKQRYTAQIQVLEGDPRYIPDSKYYPKKRELAAMDKKATEKATAKAREKYQAQQEKEAKKNSKGFADFGETNGILRQILKEVNAIRVCVCGKGGRHTTAEHADEMGPASSNIVKGTKKPKKKPAQVVEQANPEYEPSEELIALENQLRGRKGAITRLKNSGASKRKITNAEKRLQETEEAIAAERNKLAKLDSAPPAPTAPSGDQLSTLRNSERGSLAYLNRLKNSGAKKKKIAEAERRYDIAKTNRELAEAKSQLDVATGASEVSTAVPANARGAKTRAQASLTRVTNAANKKIKQREDELAAIQASIDAEGLTPELSRQRTTARANLTRAKRAGKKKIKEYKETLANVTQDIKELEKGAEEVAAEAEKQSAKPKRSRAKKPKPEQPQSDWDRYWADADAKKKARAEGNVVDLQNAEQPAEAFDDTQKLPSKPRKSKSKNFTPSDLEARRESVAAAQSEVNRLERSARGYAGALTKAKKSADEANIASKEKNLADANEELAKARKELAAEERKLVEAEVVSKMGPKSSDIGAEEGFMQAESAASFERSQVMGKKKKTGSDKAAQEAQQREVALTRSQIRQIEALKLARAAMNKEALRQIEILKQLSMSEASEKEIARQQIRTYGAIKESLNALGIERQADINQYARFLLTDANTRPDPKNPGGTVTAPVRVGEVEEISRVHALSQQMGGEFSPKGPVGKAVLAFFGEGGFFSRIVKSSGTFIVRNFSAGLVFGLTNALQQVLEQAILTESTFIRVSAALEATGKSLGTLRNDLQDISTKYGTSLNDVYETAAGLTGLFKNTDELTKATEVVAQLEMISMGAMTAKEAMGALASIQGAFADQLGTGADGLQHVADVLTVLQNNLGVNVEVSAEGIARMSGLARQVGMTMEETGVYAAQISKLTNTTGDVAGEQFSRIIGGMQTGRGRSAITEAFSTVYANKEDAAKGINGQKSGIEGMLGDRNYSAVLKVMQQNWNNLSDAQKSNVQVSVAGMRQAASFAALMRNGADSLALITRAQYAEGEAEKRTSQIMNTLNMQLKKLTVNFQNLANNLVRSGILNVLGATLKLANATLHAINELFTTLNDFSDSNSFTKYLKNIIFFFVGAKIAALAFKKSVSGLAGVLGYKKGAEAAGRAVADGAAGSTAGGLAEEAALMSGVAAGNLGRIKPPKPKFYPEGYRPFAPGANVGSPIAGKLGIMLDTRLTKWGASLESAGVKAAQYAAAQKEAYAAAGRSLTRWNRALVGSAVLMEGMGLRMGGAGKFIGAKTAFSALGKSGVLDAILLAIVAGGLSYNAARKNQDEAAKEADSAYKAVYGKNALSDVVPDSMYDTSAYGPASDSFWKRTKRFTPIEKSEIEKQKKSGLSKNWEGTKETWRAGAPIFNQMFKDVADGFVSALNPLNVITGKSFRKIAKPFTGESVQDVTGYKGLFVPGKTRRFGSEEGDALTKKYTELAKKVKTTEESNKLIDQLDGELKKQIEKWVEDGNVSGVELLSGQGVFEEVRANITTEIENQLAAIKGINSAGLLMAEQIDRVREASQAFTTMRGNSKLQKMFGDITSALIEESGVKLDTNPVLRGALDRLQRGGLDAIQYAQDQETVLTEAAKQADIKYQKAVAEKAEEEITNDARNRALQLLNEAAQATENKLDAMMQNALTLSNEALRLNNWEGAIAELDKGVAQLKGELIQPPDNSTNANWGIPDLKNQLIAPSAAPVAGLPFQDINALPSLGKDTLSAPITAPIPMNSPQYYSNPKPALSKEDEEYNRKVKQKLAEIGRPRQEFYSFQDNKALLQQEAMGQSGLDTARGRVTQEENVLKNMLYEQYDTGAYNAKDIEEQKLKILAAQKTEADALLSQDVATLSRQAAQAWSGVTAAQLQEQAALEKLLRQIELNGAQSEEAQSALAEYTNAQRATHAANVSEAQARTSAIVASQQAAGDTVEAARSQLKLARLTLQEAQTLNDENNAKAQLRQARAALRQAEFDESQATLDRSIAYAENEEQVRKVIATRIQKAQEAYDKTMRDAGNELVMPGELYGGKQTPELEAAGKRYLTRRDDPNVSEEDKAALKAEYEKQLSAAGWKRSDTYQYVNRKNPNWAPEENYTTIMAEAAKVAAETQGRDDLYQFQTANIDRQTKSISIGYTKAADGYTASEIARAEEEAALRKLNLARQRYGEGSKRTVDALLEYQQTQINTSLAEQADLFANLDASTNLEAAGAGSDVDAAKSREENALKKYQDILARTPYDKTKINQAFADYINATKETSRALLNQGQLKIGVQQAMADARGDAVASAAAQRNAAKLALAMAKTKEEKLAARAQLIAADAAYERAIQDTITSKIDIGIAIATAAGHTVKAAELGLKSARIVLARALKRSGGKMTTEANQAKAQEIAANAAFRDAKLQDQLDTIDFNLQMNRMTASSAIAALREILKTNDLTKQQKRQLLLQIKGMQDELSNSPWNFGNIQLPKPYQMRRYIEEQKQANTARLDSMVGDSLRISDSIGGYNSGGMTSTSSSTYTDARSIEINLSGDVEQIRKVLEDILTTPIKTRTPSSRRGRR